MDFDVANGQIHLEKLLLSNKKYFLTQQLQRFYAKLGSDKGLIYSNCLNFNYLNAHYILFFLMGTQLKGIVHPELKFHLNVDADSVEIF